MIRIAITAAAYEAIRSMLEQAAAREHMKVGVVLSPS
jgi:hypothetical protein